MRMMSLHYEKSFDLPADWVGKGVLLHLDAVDQICDVFLNGHFVGHHESGYSPLVIFIQYALGHNVIDVTVTDDTDSAVFPRGKQANYPSGIWYTPTSGIWQSVWLESVPSDGYLESLELHPDFDEQKLTIKAVFEGIKQLSEVECYYRGQLVAKSAFDQEGVRNWISNTTFTLVSGFALPLFPFDHFGRRCRPFLFRLPQDWHSSTGKFHYITPQ
jgi:beta-galactosidase/beta-glucuronidase